MRKVKLVGAAQSGETPNRWGEQVRRGKENLIHTSPWPVSEGNFIRTVSEKFLNIAKDPEGRGYHGTQSFSVLKNDDPSLMLDSSLQFLRID